jgi:hypothetical protein
MSAHDEKDSCRVSSFEPKQSVMKDIWQYFFLSKTGNDDGTQETKSLEEQFLEAHHYALRTRAVYSGLIEEGHSQRAIMLRRCEELETDPSM